MAHTDSPTGGPGRQDQLQPCNIPTETRDVFMVPCFVVTSTISKRVHQYYSVLHVAHFRFDHGY